MLRRTGAVAAGGVLGASAISGSASAAPTFDEQGTSDGKTVYEVSVLGDMELLRIEEPGETPGSIDVKVGDGWKPVVDRFEVFVNRSHDDYIGVMSDWSESVEAWSKIVMVAAVGAMLFYVPSSGSSGGLIVFASTIATGVLQEFVDLEQWSFGVREKHVFGHATHFPVVDKGYNDSIKGTIPVDEPEGGEIA